MSGWAMVTGSSKGIGAGIVEGLAGDGFDVIVHYGRDRDGAEAVAHRCADVGVRSRVVGADLREDPGPLAAVAEDVGGLAVLVNNAGVTADGLAMTMSDDDFALTWQVNVAAAFALTRAELRRMLRGRAGRIVMKSSVVGLHGDAGQANYAASKAAHIGMTKSIAREVGKRGITANVVAPGFIETAMTAAVDTSVLIDRVPAGRLGTVDEVAAAVRFLCSPAAAYVNGSVLQVDGGLFA
jgi:3-oxoacyl-[acyl-carrier protein] reductase